MSKLNKTIRLVVLLICGLVLLACNSANSPQPAQPPPNGQPPLGQPPPGGQPQPGEPQVTFTSDRTSLKSGECATLSWNAQGNVFVADINGQRVNLTGQQQVCPKESTRFVLSVDAGKSVIQREVLIDVQLTGGQPPPIPPVITPSLPSPPTNPPSLPAGCSGPPTFASPFTASPSTIAAGQSTTLSWGNVTNGTSGSLVGSLKLEPGFGEVGSGASQRTAKPNQTTTYTLTATGCGGTATRQVTVVVSGFAITPIPGFVVPTATLPLMQIAIVDPAIDDIYPEATGKISVRLKNLGNVDITNASIPLNCSATVVQVANPTGVSTLVMPPTNITVNLKVNQTAVFDTGFGRDPSIQTMHVSCTISPALIGDKKDNNSLTKQVK